MVLDVNVGTIISALRIKDTSRACYWDCLIATTRKEHGLTAIYTEDLGFKKIEGIKIVNPFAIYPT
ncbi:TPA: PIN domain-containing protein [Candidatus Woesearchaeota archaeon]|nr:PIN domain-containing protein [Candidatus Woesearchaeota archaeon]